MGSVSPALPVGITRESLEAVIALGGEGSIPLAVRREAFARFESLAPPRAPQGRFWKHDYAKIDMSDITLHDGAPEPAANASLFVTPFHRARADHPDVFEQAFRRALDTLDDRFAALAIAFQSGGTFVHIPAGAIIDDPIVLTYRAAGADRFPYTLVVLGEGAQATIIEQATGDAGAFACGINEIILGDRASLTYAAVQQTGSDGRIFATRRAVCGADATLRWSLAELGGSLVRTTLSALLAKPGGNAEITSLFFNSGDQHVDLSTEVDHAVGPTRSQTVVKSVATGRGQGRYLGNILIRAGAHGADAALRDDALLLSKQAHIDSVPALEISANDVKAFHGATVGSIDEEELFYVTSRGIARTEAERMIALGFFEPAVERFPTEALRARIRTDLEAKLE